MSELEGEDTPKGILKGKAYRGAYPNLLGRKFANPRDLSGVPNTKHLKIIREVEEHLRPIPGFVALTLRGSTAVGLREKKSDVDIGVLYDSAIAGHDRDYFHEKIEKFTKNYRGLLRQITGRATEVSAGAFFQHDLNLLRTTDHFVEDPIEDESIVSLLLFLSEVTSGTEVEKYRALASTCLQRMGPEDRHKLLGKLFKLIESIERGNFIKMGSRMPESLGQENLWDSILNSDTMKKFVGDRKNLWRNRLIKFFELDEKEFAAI